MSVPSTHTVEVQEFLLPAPPQYELMFKRDLLHYSSSVASLATELDSKAKAAPALDCGSERRR